MQQLLESFTQIIWKKDQKFYKVMLQCTLFEEVSVVCCWGVTGGGRGGQKIITCTTVKAVETTIANIIKRRRIRGYIMNGETK